MNTSSNQNCKTKRMRKRMRLPEGRVAVKLNIHRHKEERSWWEERLAQPQRQAGTCTQRAWHFIHETWRSGEWDGQLRLALSLQGLILAIQMAPFAIQASHQSTIQCLFKINPKNSADFDKKTQTKAIWDMGLFPLQFLDWIPKKTGIVDYKVGRT